jgi:NAD+ synthase (glutamine-hydrolysing)
MKIALAQINYTIGDFDGNFRKMSECIVTAKIQGCQLIIFSELSVCGYIPSDMLNYDSFIKKCHDSLERLIPLSQNIGIIAGCPVLSRLLEGKMLYNAAFLLQDGQIKQQVNKSLLPTYDIFDEYRYFEPNNSFNVVAFEGIKIALTICEDLWNIAEPRLYDFCPMDRLMPQHPDIIINISGSPYSYNHTEERKQLMQQNAKVYGLPLIYVNQVGAHTDLLFDGGSLFVDREGNVIEELAYFKEELRVIEWDMNREYQALQTINKDDDIEVIREALVMGIRDYFQKSGFKKAILGLSGGIDSALVNALAVEALGAKNVLSVLLPSKFSSKGSIEDSVDLCRKTGNDYKIIPILEPVEALEKTLDVVFTDHPRDVTEENLQARSRGILLMAICNKLGHILLNTSNKSESAVGYATLYGDMCGGLSVIGDLYKTQVYEMCRSINKTREIIPLNILTKAPSAELRPNQLDSDSLPPYDVLDKILLHYIENQKGRAEIVELGFDEATVRKVVRMVDNNEYKRFQAAPTLRISHKAFGQGRRMPLVAKYYD